MKRQFSAREALDIIMKSIESSSSDTTTSGESDADFVPPSSTPTSSEDDPEEDAEDTAPGWVGRNGEVWSPTNAETTHFSLPARGVTPGPTHYAVVRVDTIVSAFDLFLTTDMIELIVAMTNLNGRRSQKNWTDVDSTELRAYVGLLILAGVFRSKGETTLSLWDERSGRAIFRATMSRRRFHDINSALRFDDKLQRPARLREDRLAPIRNLWEQWRQRLPLLFNPDIDVTVDEQLVPFKGRCKFKQYMPKKPARYGLKIWVTADVTTSYAWRCDIYLGKCGDKPEVGQGQRVALEMTEGLQGVTVTCDNFFTTYPLAQELLKRKLALVGTVRKNKPELPPNLVQVKGRAALSSVFAFTRNTTAVSYVRKRGRNVILLSTRHREPALTEGPKQKPEIVVAYNRCKGGVDNLDKVCANTYLPHASYSC